LRFLADALREHEVEVQWLQRPEAARGRFPHDLVFLVKRGRAEEVESSLRFFFQLQLSRGTLFHELAAGIRSIKQYSTIKRRAVALTKYTVFGEPRRPWGEFVKFGSYKAGVHPAVALSFTHAVPQKSIGVFVQGIERLGVKVARIPGGTPKRQGG